jgi:NADPH2:quinone reductase
MTSGVNPSDWKSRSGRTAPMSAPLIIPYSDGAGDIDRVGPGVANRLGERVWVWNGQWRRPHGTAAEYVVLSSAQAVLLPEHIGYAEGACFGIPALTALQAVHPRDDGDRATNQCIQSQFFLWPHSCGSLY